MSYRVLSKKKRLTVGIGAASIIAIGFSVGFYFQPPHYQGPTLFSVDIYKERAKETLALYEALPDNNCVKVLNENSTLSAPPPKKAPKNPLDAPLISASAPKCSGVSVFPADYQKLGNDGFVTLSLNVDKTGKIERGEVDGSSGFADLDEAALKQVTDTWSLEPCKKLGKAVACKQKIKFRWQM